jgi:hypothetical protein
MTWLKSNGATLAGALILSLLTVGMLTDRTPEEPSVTATLLARFDPKILAEVGSLQYSVEGRVYREEIPVVVTGDAAQVHATRLKCEPTLDESKFDTDPSVRETSIRLTAADFNLTRDQAQRLHIQAVTVGITYARLIPVTLPIKASVADIQDTRNARYQVDSITVEPPEIKVKIPANQLNLIKELPIRPIRIGGRTSSFRVQGEINTDLVDVRKPEPFIVAIELSPIQFKREMEGVPLYLSSPPIPEHNAELIDRMTFKVILVGPQDVVEKLQPEQVHVYVKLDWSPTSKPGDFALPIRCDLTDEQLRKLVRVNIAPGEAIIAVVRVTRS